MEKIKFTYPDDRVYPGIRKEDFSPKENNVPQTSKCLFDDRP